MVMLALLVFPLVVGRDGGPPAPPGFGPDMMLCAVYALSSMDDIDGARESNSYDT